MKQSTRHSALHKCSYRKETWTWIHPLPLINCFYEKERSVPTLPHKYLLSSRTFYFLVQLFHIDCEEFNWQSYFLILLSTVGELWGVCHHFSIMTVFEKAAAWLVCLSISKTTRDGSALTSALFQVTQWHSCQRQTASLQQILSWKRN